MKVKTLALTTLAALALAIGVSGTRQTAQVKADSSEYSRLVETAYDHHVGLDLGSANAQQVFDDGLYWLREDVDATVVEANGEKALELAIVSDDGGGYARAYGVGSGGNGLEKLQVGYSYEITTYLDLSNIDASSTVWYEFSVQDQWTGLTIQNGVVAPCDANHIYNYSYQNNILKFSLHAREFANGESCRPYGKVTIQNANIGDTLVVGYWKAVETGLYSMDFEQFAVGAEAPAGNVSAISNVYNESMTSVTVQHDDVHGNYLNVTYENTSGDTVWPVFYFNQFWNVTDGSSYRLSVDIISNNSIELYFKYQSAGDGCYTLYPSGAIADSGHNQYIVNPYWDGTHFQADITFSSGKDSNWWQQFCVVFAAAAGITTTVQLDNFELFPLERCIEAYTVDSSTLVNSFACDAPFSTEGLRVVAFRNDGTSFVLDEGTYTVDSSSYIANVPGEYQISILIKNVDGYRSTNLQYTVTVSDKAESISLVSAPTKTTYRYGETLDLTGLAVNLVYRSGATESVTVTEDMISGYDSHVLGSQTVTVTYNEFTTTFNVFVEDYAVGIEVASNPTKVEYKYGEALDLAGLAINEVYASGAKQAVNVEAVTVSGYESNVLGSQTVQVSYNGFTATFNVSVADYVVGITLKSAPTKVEYEIGEELDVTGGVITVDMASGAHEDVNITKDMVSGFNSSVAADSLVLTVTYNGFTATFTVKVNEAPVPVDPEVPGGDEPGDEEPGDEEPGEKKGCKGSIVATSAIISGLALAGIALVSLKKKEDK